MKFKLLSGPLDVRVYFLLVCLGTHKFIGQLLFIPTNGKGINWCYEILMDQGILENSSIVGNQRDSRLYLNIFTEEPYQWVFEFPPKYYVEQIAQDVERALGEGSLDWVDEARPKNGIIFNGTELRK